MRTMWRKRAYIDDDGHRLFRPRVCLVSRGQLGSTAEGWS